MKALDLVREAAARIGGDSARLDAELIVAHALGMSREALLLTNPDAAADAADGLVARRTAGEPVAYILGRQEFWSLEFAVGPGVLFPRAETETLIAAALRLFPRDRALRILDLGTGSGALMLAALSEWPNAAALGVDVSDAALAHAEANARRLGLADRCRVMRSDWTDSVEGRFDLILCNPPYIGAADPVGPGVRKHEPAGALFAGADGLDAYLRIVPAVGALMNEDAAAILEIGWRQADAVLALAAGAGLTGTVERDLAGRDRAVVMRKSGMDF